MVAIPRYFVAPTRLFAPSVISNRGLRTTHNPCRSYTPYPMGTATSSPDVAPLATAGTPAAGASKPPSKGKARATAPIRVQRTTSNIENEPAVPATSGDASTSATPAPPEKEKLPLYSYKQYPPTPAVVYTRHEEEANDLVECLKGPLGFDLEWPVVFRRGRAPSERRTALVQICDARMIVLVQVSAMNSTYEVLLRFYQH